MRCPWGDCMQQDFDRATRPVCAMRGCGAPVWRDSHLCADCSEDFEVDPDE